MLKILCLNWLFVGAPPRSVSALIPEKKKKKLMLKLLMLKLLMLKLLLLKLLMLKSPKKSEPY